MSGLRVKFLADECCDASVVGGLRSTGHDVHHVQETHKGVDDATVLTLAVAESRILVTEDKDFGDYAVRQRVPLPGVILLRIDPANRSRKAERILQLLADFSDRLAQHYTVVSEDRFRFRRLPESP